MIKSKHMVTKAKHRCFWGRKTEGQASFGSILGRFGGILGWLWGVRGRSGGVRGGSGEAAGGRKKKIISGGLKLWNFVKTLICFWNGWKLIKINFSMDFFLKVDLIGCFRELNVRKFRKFSPDHFYDPKNRFYDKKTDFRPEIRELILEWNDLVAASSETTW